MQVSIKGSNTKLFIAQNDIVDFGVKYIIDVYNMATVEEKAKDWYTDAKSFASELSVEFSTDIITVAKVISALSPMQKWETNKKQARQALINWTNGNCAKVGMYQANSDKVYAILDGQTTTWGLKTESFYHNILGYTDRVTIDSLAILIVVGLYDQPVNCVFKDATYKYVENLYKLAAIELNRNPVDTQAITWEVSRRIKKSFKGQRQLMQYYTPGMKLRQLSDIVRSVNVG